MRAGTSPQRTLAAAPLSADAFAPFGDVIAAGGEPSWLINEGRCGRYHDLARVDIAEGRSGISLFASECVALPYAVDMMERHPLGSQAFLPMGEARTLVVVAPDADGAPGLPQAFVAAPGVGFNIARNVWHGVLAPLAGGRYFVIDYVGEAANLKVHRFADPYLIR